MANSKINVTDLDFDQIKNNLKEYLKGQSEFTDYNFDGSALSTLLDILAYNTHYQGLYYNLAVNEAFLDSASKRSSVVSKAKELGYAPKSKISAQATVNVYVINSQLSAPQFIELPKHTRFSASIDGDQFSFYTLENHIAQRVNTTYTFNGITIREGYPLTYRYVIAENDSQKIIIPNAGVDTSSITVSVQENAEVSEFTTFVESSTILDADGSSKIYFLSELSSGQHQVEFGNDVVGKRLGAGNVVTIEYFVSRGADANGIKSFSYSGNLGGGSTFSVVTVEQSSGGSDEEQIESIRWNAPRVYTTQNRCVTANDYKSIITAHYPNVKSIAVWGGDTNTPPEYGKVFISIVPKTMDFLPQSEKDFILREIVNPRKSLTITPQFTDASYLTIELDVSFYYNPALTTRSAGDISSLVYQTVIDYNDQNLNNFGDVFRLSRLSTLIDSTENSIVSNITTIKLHREINPIYNIVNSYQIDVGNPIYNSGSCDQSVVSTGFYCTDSDQICYIEDYPVNKTSEIGSLRLFYINTDGNKIYLRSVGTINYSTGVINVVNLNVTGLYQTAWNFVIKPRSNDVVSTKNQFVRIGPTLLKVTPVIDTLTKSYTFTSSRN